MLCSTANELYWMSRHIERAENMARLLDVTYRMSLLPYQAVEPGLAWAEPWAVPLVTNGLAKDYYQRHPVLAAESVLRYLALDPGNSSSIFSCLRSARESARSVRGAITSEMYEDLNSAWLEIRQYDYDRVQSQGVSEFLDWVKMRSHLFRGVTFGTMLRDEAYHFIRLGTHIERADNTARILDTKYHILLPSTADVGGAVDYYQWASLLQSLSGYEYYGKVDRDVISPRRVAELLVLRDDMPRSLHSCLNFIDETLEVLCDENSRELRRQAGELHARLHYGKTEDIIRFGLHEYLMDFLARVSALVGDSLREIKARDAPYLTQNNIDASGNFLIGGQIRGEPHRLFNVYGEGNFIEASPDTCYFQIGESKYGKPVIDRVIKRDSSLLDATKCTVVSFDSTMRSNISVGLPIDLLVYEADSLTIKIQRRIEETDAYFQMMHREWGEGLRRGVLPPPP